MNKSLIASVVLAIVIIGSAIYYVNYNPNNNKEVSMQEDSTIKNLSATEFNNELKTALKEGAVLIDVRTAQEYNQGYIKGAINMDFYSPDFRDSLSKLDKNKRYYIYCRSGSRSGQTAKIMQELGFKDVRNLQFGIKDWVANDLPLEK